MSFPKCTFIPREYAIELRRKYHKARPKLAVEANILASTLGYFENGRNLQAINLFYVLENLAKVYNMPVEVILHMELEYQRELRKVRKVYYEQISDKNK